MLFLAFGFSLSSYALNGLNLVFLGFSIPCLVDENHFIDGKQTRLNQIHLGCEVMPVYKHSLYMSLFTFESMNRLYIGLDFLRHSRSAKPLLV